MPTYYFEIETRQTGWLRMEADSEDEAREDIKENGFNASNIIDSDIMIDNINIEGGEEED